MTLFRKLVSGFLLSCFISQTVVAGPLTDLLDAFGLGQLVGQVPVVGTIGASVLDPNGTGDNDLLGADVLNPENDLGLTLLAGELLGFGNHTGSGTAVPLDFLGLSDLLTALGLTYSEGSATVVRGLLAQDGTITSLAVTTLDDVLEMLAVSELGLTDGLAAGLPGLNDQPIGLAILAEPNSGNSTSDGLLGLALLTPGSSGNGGLIGVSILSGPNSGNGSAVGVAVLSGSNSGNGGNVGASVLGGNDSGNGGDIGAGVLNGDNSGNGGSVGAGVLNGDDSGNGAVAAAVLNGDDSGNSEFLSVAALNEDNSGNSDFASVAAVNGDDSGNTDVLSVAALNGDNSGNSDFAAVGALNGANSGAGGVITVVVANAVNGSDPNTALSSCSATGGVGCGDTEFLPTLESCKDSDGDGVCDSEDECGDTPANTPVFLTGCHLTKDAPLVLRGVNFEFDKWDLTPESIPILEHAVKVLEAKPEALVAVDGHTDAKGSFEYNDRLSYRRAGTVYDYLLAAGIKEDRLVFRGYGENVPVAPNENEDGSDNPEGRAENRRVELNILEPATFAEVKEMNEARQ